MNEYQNKINATITSKHQITIPAIVRRNMNLKTKDMITFTEVDGKYMIEKAVEKSICPICNGDTVIVAETDLPCFYCEGKGGIVAHRHRIHEYLPILMTNSRSYQIQVTFYTYDAKSNSYLTFPVIQLFSKKYPLSIMEKAQDALQYEIIVANTPLSVSNLTKYMKASQIFIDEAISLMKTEYGRHITLEFFSDHHIFND